MRWQSFITLKEVVWWQLSHRWIAKGQEGALAPLTANIARGHTLIRTLGAAFPPLFLVCIFSMSAAAKCVAVIAPDRSEQAREIAAILSDDLKDLNAIDTDMATSAFKAVAPENPFNMTVAQGKRVGLAIGCEYVVLVRSDTFRRSSSARTEYYEAFAAVYTVSSRTGRLVDWRLVKHTDGSKITAS